MHDAMCTKVLFAQNQCSRLRMICLYTSFSKKLSIGNWEIPSDLTLEG